jgi:hypothetical protein
MSEPLVPISDVMLQGPLGAELYRLTSIKVRLKLEAERANGLSLTRKKYASELALSKTAPHSAFMAAIQKKIDFVKRAIYKEHLVSEDIADCTRVIALDRSAFIIPDADRFLVTYYSADNLNDKAHAPTAHSSKDGALESAKAWVLAAR